MAKPLKLQSKNSEGYELKIEFEVPEGADENKVVEAIKAMVLSLDDLHVAYGGNGLKVNTIEVRTTTHKGPSNE